MKLDFTKYYDLINPSFWDFFDCKDRIRISIGGGGSGKSFEAFQEMVYKLLVEPGHNYLVCRKVAATIKTSTYALTVQLINEMKLNKVFKINKSDMSITSRTNGNMAVFKGLDDIEKIKSITFPKGILTDIIVEEASEITQKDFDQLNVRLRGRKPDSIPFQITLLLNPISDKHWIKREFFDLKSYQKNTPVTILKTTYKDNEFIDDDYRAILEGYKDIDYEFYRVYCLGEWGAFGNLIFNNWSFGTCPYTEEDFDSIYVGLDFGFTHPQVLIKHGFKDGVMYSYSELCLFEKTNMEFISTLKEFDFIRPGEKIICDSAEPSKIKELVQHGFGAVAAVKGKDSVTRGIDFIKAQNWIIDDSKCPRLAQEVQQYHWKVEKDGTATDKPVDLFDDCLVGDSIVNTLQGDFPIKDLIGQSGFLKCIDRKGKITKSFFHSVKQVRKKKIIRIETIDNRIIRCSDDHLILTKRGWIQAKNLNENDFIVDIKFAL